MIAFGQQSAPQIISPYWRFQNVTTEQQKSGLRVSVYSLYLTTLDSWTEVTRFVADETIKLNSFSL